MTKRKAEKTSLLPAVEFDLHVFKDIYLTSSDDHVVAVIREMKLAAEVRSVTLLPPPLSLSLPPSVFLAFLLGRLSPQHSKKSCREEVTNAS